MKNRLSLLFLFILISPVLYAENCPMHLEQSDHHADVDRKGDEVMGFEHAKSEHHFFLKKDGGTIEARIQDEGDTKTLEKIRSHMKEISRLFAERDFSKPEAIHGMIPPGANTMIKLRDRIEFQYVSLEDGAQVNMTTSDPEALEAIHKFIRFQISEHRTGDPE